MNRQTLRRLGVGAALALVGNLSAGLVDAPAHAASATGWTDLANAINTATGAVSVQLAANITQPAGSLNLAIKPGAIITLDLHHSVLTATSQAPGRAGIGLPLGAKLIVEDTGVGAPGELIATGGAGDPATGVGAGAGIGGNGETGAGDAAGALIVLAGHVTANGGAAALTGRGGAGAGVGGGGGGGGVGATNGSAGGQIATVRVSGGTLTAHGGSGHAGGAGAGVGGGGGGASDSGTGGAGGRADIFEPGGVSGTTFVTDSGVLDGTGGSATGSDNGGGAAGIGGGGGGAGSAGGAGGVGLLQGHIGLNVVGPATVRGTGGTGSNGGGGAGIGGGGGAATGGPGGTPGGDVYATNNATVIDSGAGASHSGGGGADKVDTGHSAATTWLLSFTDTTGGRAPRGASYDYVVNPRNNLGGVTFSEFAADTFTVTVTLPRGVITSGATGEDWACSTSPAPQTVTCSWIGNATMVIGLPLPITVPVTVTADAWPGAILTATATISSGDLPATTRTDAVTVTAPRRHHH